MGGGFCVSGNTIRGITKTKREANKMKRFLEKEGFNVVITKILVYGTENKFYIEGKKEA